MALFNQNGRDVTAEVPHKFHNKEQRDAILAPLQERHVLTHKHAGKFFRMEERAVFQK